MGIGVAYPVVYKSLGGQVKFLYYYCGIYKIGPNYGEKVYFLLIWCEM